MYILNQVKIQQKKLWEKNTKEMDAKRIYGKHYLLWWWSTRIKQQHSRKWISIVLYPSVNVTIFLATKANLKTKIIMASCRKDANIVAILQWSLSNEQRILDER